MVPGPLAAPTGQASAHGASPGLRCRDRRFRRGRGHGTWAGSGADDAAPWPDVAGQPPCHPQSVVGMAFLSSWLRLSIWKPDGHLAPSAARAPRSWAAEPVGR